MAAVTRLGLEGFGVRRVGSFAGRAVVEVISATALSWIARYRYMLNRYGETIQIRRFTGVGGARTFVDYDVIARPTAAVAQPLAGSVLQNDREIIFLAQDLRDIDFPGKVTNADAAVVQGKVYAITEADDWTAVVKGTLIAWKLKVKG